MVPAPARFPLPARCSGATTPGAECVTVTDGKITYSRFVFDRLPFDVARKAAN